MDAELRDGKARTIGPGMPARQRAQLVHLVLHHPDIGFRAGERKAPLPPFDRIGQDCGSIGRDAGRGGPYFRFLPG
jgi:hypothetical protein